MNTRFICPHCHSPIDPRAMDVVVNGQAECRICPECDEPIVFGTAGDRAAVSNSGDIGHPADSSPRCKELRP